MKKQKTTYWDRVIKGKGTVADRWPTAKDLWNDPTVKKLIDEHNKRITKQKEV